jgi:hypothetical protein
MMQSTHQSRWSPIGSDERHLLEFVSLEELKQLLLCGAVRQSLQLQDWAFSRSRCHLERGLSEKVSKQVRTENAQDRHLRNELGFPGLLHASR